jgi:hypothetical protein
MDPEKLKGYEETMAPEIHLEIDAANPQSVRYDPHGYPVVPQPTHHKDDPLVFRTLYFPSNSNTKAQ